MSLAPVASQTIGQGTMTPTWTPGPAKPRLRRGALHVWRVDLDLVDDRLQELLDREERERAGRILGARSRQLWSRSRGALRALLSAYLGTEPRALRFAIGAHGKPALPERSRPYFNLSHSGNVALYAVTDTGAVGIDVEAASRSFDALALAARAFGPAEVDRLADLETALRKREFLRLWTRHEAALKCVGSGIGCSRASEIEPSIIELDVGSHASAAVAFVPPLRELRLWDWQGYVASSMLPAGPQAVDGK